MPRFTQYYLRQWLLMHAAFARRLVTGREPDAMGLMQHSCARLGLTGSVSFYRELLWQWYKPLADCAHVEPGALDALDALQARGLKLGIVSNTFVPGFAVDRHLEREGLLPYFPYRIYSADVQVRKPDPRIFTVAAAALGLPPQQIAFVGDQWRTDVRGARRAGMLAIHKRPPSPFELTQPQAVPRLAAFQSLPDLLDPWAMPAPPPADPRADPAIASPAQPGP
jgi:HAD superfamily hydrolase (TIGR01509 family)